MLPGRHRGPPAQLEVSAHASTTPLSRRRPCARAPKAEVSRKLCVGGGASSAVLPFRRRRACSATPPVAGCGSPSPGVDSALLPRLACLRVHGCKPLGFRCCVQRARGQRAVSSWAREGWGSPGVGLSRDGGTSPLPLPERGDPQAVQEQPRFLTPGCCLRRAVRSGQSGGPAPTSRDSVRRGPAPRVFKLQPLMYPRLPVPLERETPGAAVTDLSAGGRWGWGSGRARSAGGP